VIFVDTSVWAAYFNGEALREVSLLDNALAGERQPIAVLPIVITEVLQGFRSDSGFERAAELLCQLTVLTLSLESYVRAAGLFRRLRQKGVTVRGAVDCLIAQACIESGAELLTLDKVFALVARHTELALA
jgi:predicted nucleic acid-binding protein